MKQTLTEKDLRTIIKKCVIEALTYDKDRKQYFPKYSGDPHKDAGMYTDNNKDDFNFSRNKYNWSDQQRGDQFYKKQINNDTEPDPFNPDWENEENAEAYTQYHGFDQILEKAETELQGDLDNCIDQFAEIAMSKFKLFKNSPDALRELLYYKLKDMLDNYDGQYAS